jgi:broad specificity phosphatase PhoE
VLIVVRHGRTELNASGRLLGRLDPPLDEVGERQAAAVAALLARPPHHDGRVTRVVSSPLLRARATAAAIAGAAGVEVEVDDRWVEVDYGEFDGLPLAEVPPEVWANWRVDADYAPPGGESLGSVASRVEAACLELVASGVGGTDHDTVVVTHVSPLKAAVGWALDAGHGATWRTFVSPGSVTRIGVGPHGPVLHSFNERPPDPAG